MSRALLAAMAASLAACAVPPHRAPVEDRMASEGGATTGAAAAPASAASAPAAPAANGQTYVVKPGDTLLRISLDTGTRVSDLVRWNNLDNPDRIEVGRALRVTPPPGEAVAAARPVPPASKVEAHALPPSGSASGTPAAPPASGVGAPVNAAVPAAPHEAETTLQWAWPAAGPVTTPFDEGKNKGINIAGKAGDPVYAAADGQVVYAGSGLYGYGNLVIVKHNATYLTAYAFNRALLVKEDQFVKRGQKIAEMGSTGSTDRVQLHFEIRRQGKPVDPTQLLPAR